MEVVVDRVPVAVEDGMSQPSQPTQGGDGQLTCIGCLLRNLSRNGVAVDSMDVGPVDAKTPFKLLPHKNKRYSVLLGKDRSIELVWEQLRVCPTRVKSIDIIQQALKRYGERTSLAMALPHLAPFTLRYHGRW